MASPTNEAAKAGGAYALVESYSRDDLPPGTKAPKYDKLRELLDSPEEKTTMTLLVHEWKLLKLLF